MLFILAINIKIGYNKNYFNVYIFQFAWQCPFEKSDNFQLYYRHLNLTFMIENITYITNNIY